MARDARLDPSNLSRIERGLQRPSLDVLMRIAKALGLRNVVDTVGLFVEEQPE